MRSILIVEDDDDMREVMTLALEGRGYRVAGASTGAEALDIMRAEGVALVLLDLMMPVMDGWQLRSEQLKDPRLGAIPVVLVSGASGLADAASELHVEHFLVKPFELTKMLDMVETLLPLRPSS